MNYSKRIWFFLLCLAPLLSMAQDSIKINLINQYDARMKAVTVRSNGVAYTTNEKGEVSIPAGSDSFTVEQEGAANITQAVKDLPADGKVPVKKPFNWKDLITPMFYIINGGLWLVIFIVFAETGLLAGFFLPGDSLLFIAGIYAIELINRGLGFQAGEFGSLSILILLISIAGILGNTAGYWFGYKSGAFLFQRKDTWLFKKKYLHQAHDFFEKHGGSAVVIARFLPIVRTFAPIIAGIVKMEKKKFMFFNIVGCVAWVVTMILAGHFLQKWLMSAFQFDLKEHLELIVIGIVLLTTAPVIVKMASARVKKNSRVDTPQA